MTAIDPGPEGGPRGGMALAFKAAQKLRSVAQDSSQMPAVRSAARGALEALGIMPGKDVASVVSDAEAVIDDPLATSSAKVRAIAMLEKVLRRKAR